VALGVFKSLPLQHAAFNANRAALKLAEMTTAKAACFGDVCSFI